MKFINLLAAPIFLILFILGRAFHLDELTILPGLFLLFYLPGLNFNSIFLRDYTKSSPWHVEIPLNIISSITITYAGFFFAKRFFWYSEDGIVSFVLILNIVLLISALIYNRNKPSLAKQKEDKTAYIILSIPILVFALKIAINPYINEPDSMFYIESFRNIISSGRDYSFVTTSREGFAFIMTASKYVAGIDAAVFFKILAPLIFYIVSIMLFSLCQNIKNNWLKYGTFLLIVSAPTLSVMNERVRPETFILIYSIPTIILAMYSIKQLNIRLAVASLFFALCSFKFHQFGIFLVISVLPSIALVMWEKSKGHPFVYYGRYFPKSIFGKILILLPYLLLLKIYSGNLLKFINSDYIGLTTRSILEKITDFHWNWWFLSNYVAIDGGKINFSILESILYYLYNGIIPIALCLLMAVLIIWKNKKNSSPQGVSNSHLHLVPVITLLVIHFTMAEILPRINIPLLPNRSWSYIIISIIILTTVAVKKIEQLSLFKSSKPLVYIIFLMYAASISSGVIGSVYASTTIGAMVSKNEKSVIDKVHSMEEKSAFTSTQMNQILVQLYGEKYFARVQQDEVFQDKESFKEKIILKYNLEIEKQSLAVSDSVSILSTKNTSYTIGNNTYDIESIVSNVEEWDRKAAILSKYDKDRLDNLNGQLKAIEKASVSSLYFVYSFEKLDSAASLSEVWKSLNDYKNYDFFRDYTGNDVVFKDDFAIIIKIL